jgi:uncharacterized protein YkwD
MFKFFRKIFLILIVGILIFVWFKFKDNSKDSNTDNIAQYGTSSLESIGDILKEQVKNVFSTNNKVDSSDSKEVKDGYKLESLQNGNSQNDSDGADQQFGGTEDAIITLINKERFDMGLDSLDKSRRLMKSALAKAEDMQRDQYFEHISKQKIQPWFFAEEVEYQYEKFGENIALDYLSVNSVHKAFMDSIGHKANILDDSFRDIGVAIFPIETKEGIKYIIVQHFGEQLKDIDPEEKDKYSDKSKRFCEIQKNKKIELKEMIKNQKEVIEEFEKEINKNAIEEENQRLKSLRKIKEKVEEYLDNCKVLQEKYRE